MTLKQLIEAGKFDWVEKHITDENFPAPKELRTDYKLFHFSESISSEEVIKKIDKEGYVPANLYELLSWEDWNETDIVIALGSSAHVGGGLSVPGLGRCGAGRGLGLFWYGGGWSGDGRFLAVRNLPLDTQEVSTPDTLALCISDIEKLLERMKLLT